MTQHHAATVGDFPVPPAGLGSAPEVVGRTAGGCVARRVAPGFTPRIRTIFPLDRLTKLAYTVGRTRRGAALSLRKSPTRTPAFLEANRRNARKSTGPWTRRGKAQSCLNRLKTGARSRVYRRLWGGLLDAPPCAVERMAGALLTREQAAHSVFAELVDLARWAESMVAGDERRFREFVAAKQTEWGASKNEPHEPAGAEEAGKEFLKEQEHLTPRRQGAEAQRKQTTFTFERGRGQKKKMLEIDVGSRKVIENTRNDDILSSDLTDILGNSAPVLTEIAQLGATKVTFSMRFNRQCTVLATPRCEPQNISDAPRTKYPRSARDADLLTPTGLRMGPHTASAARLRRKAANLFNGLGQIIEGSAGG